MEHEIVRSVAAAQKDAQAAIESDEMNYEAVKKQIQKLSLIHI